MVERNPTLAKKLRSILLRLPSIFHYACTSDLKTSLYRILYFAIASEGLQEHFEVLFPGIAYSSAFPTSWEDAIIQDHEGITQKGRFYDKQKKGTNKSHKGRICSQKIQPGQPVYNCYDCGIDPTCCLCDDCFNKEEHSDHNVRMHISSGDAICDCGDTDSWKVDLQCLACSESGEEDTPDLSIQLEQCIHTVIDVILDYFIDVQSMNTQTIPTVHEPLLALADWRAFKKHSNDSSLPFEKYHEIDSNSSAYCSIVWNDEFHNWDSAQDSISAALGTTGSSPQCRAIANDVDVTGRTILQTSSDVSSLIDPYIKVQKNGLVATISSSRDVTRDFICEEIINWLKRESEHPNVKVANCVRSAICDSFFQRYIPGRPVATSKLNIFNPDQNNIGLLTEDHKIPQIDGTEIDNPITVKAFKARGLKNFVGKKAFSGKTARTSKIQMLFYLEIRLWKRLRNTLRNMLMPILTTNLEARKILSTQVVEILPAVEYIQLTLDREWMLSLLDHLRLQTYYDPNIGTYLLQTGGLIRPFRSLINVYALSSDGISKYKPNLDFADWKAGRSMASESATLTGIHNIVSYIKPGSAEILNPVYLMHIIMLLELFQDSFKLTRRVGDHVERESSDYKMYFMRGRQAYEITQDIGKIVEGVQKKSSAVEDAIALITSFLSLTTRRMDNYLNIVKHDISKDSSSFIHPLHSLLVEICSNYKFFDISMLEKKVTSIDIASNLYFSGSEDTDEESKPDVLAIADDVLHSVVLTSQIGSRLWIRNGNEPFYQEGSNRSLFNPLGDIYMIQLAILSEPSRKRTLLNIYDRFGFLDCIISNTQFDDTVYEERVFSILNDCIDFFYHLLTYRLPFDSKLSRKEIEYIKSKHSVCSRLCIKPLNYSKLKRAVGDAGESPYFDEILKEVSEYQPPSGAYDYGRYTLKKEQFSKVDHMDIFNSYESADDIENALVEQLATTKKKKPTDIVLVPQMYKLDVEDSLKFKGISECLKTPLFVKFIYKALSFAISSDNEQYLPHLLHLIHAIILDDNSEMGESNTLSNFSDIPVCNLLLTIIQKEDMPKSIVKKASTLLDILLLKDDNILQSLIDCFGETHINDFKKSAHGRNFETRKERARRLALKRQQKILKKMSTQQNDFMEKNKSFFKDTLATRETSPQEKAEKNDSSQEKATRTCILCRNPENYDELFGIPAFVSVSPNLWSIPTVGMNPPAFMIPGFPPSEDNPKKRKLNSDTRRSEGDRCLGPISKQSKNVIFSCSHGMHFTCFQHMLTQKQFKMEQFFCPLCEAYSNSFIPSLPFPDFKLDINDPIKATKWQDIYEADEADNCSDLTTLVFDQEFFRVLSDFESEKCQKIMKQLQLINDENVALQRAISIYTGASSDTKHALADVIGNTIELNEILRRDEPQSEVISPLSLTLLRSIIQFRLLLNYLPTDPYIDSKRAESYKAIFTASDIGFISEMMLLFFQCNESLNVLAKLKFTRRLVKMVFSILHRFNLNSDNLEIDSILTVDAKLASESARDSLTGLIKKCSSNMFRKFLEEVDPTHYSKEMVDKVYKIIYNIFAYYQRQLDILKVIFNIDDTFVTLEEIIESISDFKTMEYSISALMAISAHDLIKENSTLILDFPAKPHLAPLPEKLSEFLKNDDMTMKKASERNHLCISCGSILKSKNNHGSVCKLDGSLVQLFFSPFDNRLEIELLDSDRRIPIGFTMRIGSPYLNSHGEPAGGLIGAGESGVLSSARYNNLNKMWLNQSLVASLYRDLYKNGARNIRFPFMEQQNEFMTNVNNIFIRRGFGMRGFEPAFTAAQAAAATVQATDDEGENEEEDGDGEGAATRGEFEFEIPDDEFEDGQPFTDEGEGDADADSVWW